MKHEIADAMVVARDILARPRVREKRAQWKAIDELVARRQGERVLVAHVDVAEIQGL